MKDIAYSGLKLLIVFIVAIVVINDIGALIMTRISAGEFAQVVADSAVSSYKTSHSPAQARLAAESIAEQRGLKLTGFYLDNKVVSVNVEVPPRKTFLLHRIESLESYFSASALASADIESPID